MSHPQRKRPGRGWETMRGGGGGKAIYDMRAEGVGIREIARRLDVSRATVRKYLRATIPMAKPRGPRESKLPTWAAYIVRRVREQHVENCAVLYDELRQRGYDGGRTIRKEFVSPLRSPRQEPVTVRFETESLRSRSTRVRGHGTLSKRGSPRRLHGLSRRRLVGSAVCLALAAAGCASAQQKTLGAANESLATLPVASRTMGVPKGTLSSLSRSGSDAIARTSETSGSSQATPQVFSPNAVLDVHMVDATHGWEVTRTQVLTTSDGGQEWEVVTPPGFPGGNNDVAYFLDDAHAWVAEGGMLFRTADGGTAWQRSPLAFGNGEYIAFSDPQDGWIFCQQGAVAPYQRPVDVYRTTNGGGSWTMAGRLPVAGGKSGIAFSDARDGWVPFNMPTSLPDELYHTIDGGKTWSVQALPNPTGAAWAGAAMGMPSPPTFFNAEDGALAVGIVHLNAQGTNSVVTTIIYTTDNGGTTWNALPPLPTTDFVQPDFVSEQVIWMSGFRVNGRLYESTDGGRTWTSITPVTPPPGGLRDYQETFADAHVGIAWRSLEPGLWRTTDAGTTWTEVKGSGGRRG